MSEYKSVADKLPTKEELNYSTYIRARGGILYPETHRTLWNTVRCPVYLTTQGTLGRLRSTMFNELGLWDE